MVAEHVISAVEECKNMVPQMPLLISFDPEELRNQAAASTQRFDQGNPLSILDGIFMAVKDDIDCYPHPTKGGTTWLHDIRPVNKDAVSVSRLRSCGVIFVGKANMHELGMGDTGLNPHHGTPRNPHDPERFTGGSSSGSAAIVASGICPLALGSDGGGSIRIPASLCGVVGLKTTYGRASSVDDVMLVYAAMPGSSPVDKISLRPLILCLPNLQSSASLPMRLGKYTEMCFFMKALKSLETIDPYVQLVTQQHHIDYQFIGLEDDDRDSVFLTEDEDDADETDYEQECDELSFDYRRSDPKNQVSSSEKSIEMEWEGVDLTFPQVAPLNLVKAKAFVIYSSVRRQRVNCVLTRIYMVDKIASVMKACVYPIRNIKQFI